MIIKFIVLVLMFKSYFKLPVLLTLLTGVPRLMATARSSASANGDHTFYEVKPLKIGVEVHGINLQTDPPQEVIEQIKKDVTKYRIMVFRDQGIISGQRHVDISKWFGELESTFYKHPKSPHPDVFRVSNDENEGCTRVGRTGWHVDGSFQPAPFSYALYHIWSVPTEGDTVFVPLTELIEQLPAAVYEKWDRLWMISDRRTGRVHPLIYQHPLSGQKVLCFHLGMTEGFVYDYKTSQQRVANDEETSHILSQIHNQIVNSGLIYSHKWTAGDFIISDNLAVGHEASPQTQLPRSKVGLRVMHRTTVHGHRPPQKQYADLNKYEL